MSVQIVLALATWKLQKPVKIIWSRQESMIGHGKRHASVSRAKWGATKDGKVIAIENELIGDGGAYMYTSNKVLGNSPSPPPDLTTSPMSKQMSTASTPITFLARHSADSVRRRLCSWRKCKWTSSPKNWAWTRWRSV